MTNKNTILPILLLVASIAIMTLPTALADEGNQRLTIPQLEALIVEHTDSIAILQTSVDAHRAIVYEIYVEQNKYEDDLLVLAQIINFREEQVYVNELEIDVLDAIIAAGFQLTDSQQQAYATHLIKISENQDYMDHALGQYSLLEDLINENEENMKEHHAKIIERNVSIGLHEDAIVYLQGIMDHR